LIAALKSVLTGPADAKQHSNTDEINQVQSGIKGKECVPQCEKLVKLELSAEE